jgi:histidinol-phosphate aminotransferase
VSGVLELLRPDLRGFAGYSSARRSTVTGSVWLNANESALPSPADPALGLNRYPEPQPAALRARLAELYGVSSAQLLVTRGSDEGIDLLVRAFCRAGFDAVAIASPCFGMYAVCARVQGAPLVDVPLLDRDACWTLDTEALLTAVQSRGVRIVFLSSPANPTGQALDLEQIRGLAQALRGHAVLVLDEAYVEYSGQPSAVELLREFDNLVVLRTLSKAHALAGARIGATLADPGLIGVLANLCAPYPVPAPSAAIALAALSESGLAEARRRCAELIAERQHLLDRLRTLAGVRVAYASQGNFLLARFDNAQAAFDRLLAAGVVVRDVRAMPGLGDALRISLGTPAENSAVLAALQARAAA